jgi:hypothetical protein
VTSRSSNKAEITNLKLLMSKINLNKDNLDTSVRVAIRYGLDGPGFEHRWRRGFQAETRPAPRPKQPPI